MERFARECKKTLGSAALSTGGGRVHFRRFRLRSSWAAQAGLDVGNGGGQPVAARLDQQVRAHRQGLDVGPLGRRRAHELLRQAKAGGFTPEAIGVRLQVFRRVAQSDKWLVAIRRRQPN